MPREPFHVRLTERDDAEIEQYRPISGTAVVGLLFALASPLAILSPYLWGVPLLGICISAAASWRIARANPPIAGRTLAMVGLLLSVVVAGAAPADWLVYRYLLRREARQLAECWFAALADGQPQKAYQLVLHPKERHPWDEKLLDFYRDNPRYHTDLENYVAVPLIRTLLALGKKAQVRYYQTTSIQHYDGGDVIYMVYAVTYDEAGEGKTFFVMLELRRLTLEGGGVDWVLQTAVGGVRPEGF